MAFFNQHSFTITAFLGVAVLGFLLLRNGLQPRDLVSLGALIFGLVIAFSLIRSGETSIDDPEEILALIGTKPVLLEFHSNY